MMKIHKNVFKGLVAMLLLNVGATSFAMHNDWVVVSEAGLRVPVSERVLRLSKTFNDLLTDARGSKEIPTHFSNIQLPIIVHLMQEQQRLGGGYSTSFQMRVNEEMRPLTDVQVIDIFNAANYLDLPIVLQGIAMVIVNRVPQDKIPQALPHISSLRSPKEDVRRDARAKLMGIPGFQFLNGIQDYVPFLYIYRALNPAGVLIVNKTGYPLTVKVEAKGTRVSEVPKDGELYLDAPKGIAFTNIFSFKTEKSKALEITGANVLAEFSKLRKEPSQRNLIMTISPDRGITGLKDWFVNRVTWAAGAYGATMSKETETVTINPAGN